MQVAVGRIVRAQGLRGEVMIEVRTDEPELRFAVGSELATDPAERGPLTVASGRWQSGRLILGFDGVADRDAALELRGTWLVIDSAGITAPDDPDEFHDQQLLGLAVETVSGDRVGTVADVLHHGQDLLVVRRDAGAGQTGQAGEVLIPFVAPIVPDVDLAARRLVIDPPPGLLDDADAL
jgi:16S rRNA processing protein RimM